MERADASPRPCRLRFGVFELELDSGELKRAGRQIPLAPQAGDVLALLAREAGRMVSREEIRRCLWDEDIHVDFDQGINSCIRQIRTALGDSASSPRFVETLPRRGYRFLASVEILAESEERPLGPAVAASQQTARARGWRWPWLWGLGLALAVSLVAGGTYVVGTRQPVSSAVAERGSVPVMIAVLPFENLSGDPGQDYFSDGLTEEMIYRLGRLGHEALGVIARTSIVGFAGTRRSVAEIGRELAVDYVLEGSVRRDGERVRITVQLIETEAQTHLWAETYERELEDVFAIQSEVSERVARSLLPELVPSAVPPPPTASSEAHTAYLHGRYHFTRYQRQGYEKSLVAYREALAHDPSFALAHAGLAEAYAFLSWAGEPPRETMPLAIEMAERALSLDAAVTRAHTILGVARFYYLWDGPGAEKAFLRALEIDPGDAETHHWYSGYLSAVGRHDEAIEHDLIARRLDPVSLTVRSDLCWYDLFASRIDDAVAECQAILAIEPHHRWTLWGLVEAHLLRGDLAAARAPALRLLGLAGVPVEESEALADADLVRRLRQVSLAGLRGWASDGHPDAVSLGLAYAALGDLDSAFEWLDHGVQERAAWLVFLDVDPRFAPLRSDPRFQEIRSRVGLFDGPQGPRAASPQGASSTRSPL